MATQTKNIARLLRIMTRLRGPDGCPWDREQTHQSIRHNLIEECYEVLDALDSGNVDNFKEELGDMLMQVIFHAQIAREAGDFDFNAVAGSIADKLIRRHPHVFGRQRLKTSAQVLRQWEAIKKNEKKSTSIVAVEDLPRHLPALLKADKVQRKVARVGFDWKRVDEVVRKVEEELRELKNALASGDRRQFEEELGDLLFAAVNLARFENLQAEDLLNRAVEKFVKRFQKVELEVHKKNKTLDELPLDQLDALWESAKRSKPVRLKKNHAPVRRLNRPRRRS